jgi:phage terminase large subunit-like protein
MSKKKKRRKETFVTLNVFWFAERPKVSHDVLIYGVTFMEESNVVG